MSRTFSESWHRVADARLGLLPTVVVHKQRFRGQDWYVLRDTYTQRFFRITAQAYIFVSRLSSELTVEEVWQSCLHDSPKEAPGQEEVMQVLSQLHQSNLLFHDTLPDSQTIFQRYRDQRRRELRGKLLSFLSIRIPLFDPDRWLSRQSGLTQALVSWPMATALLLLFVLGIATALSHSDRLLSQTEGLFAAGNLFWLYICIASMKALHELGHAHVIKRFGGEVRSFGIMLIVGMPIPYVDATASWSFRDRRARALVGAAGVIVELALAALATLLWANTGTGLVNSLAFNVMLIGSVSSLLFNGNPLLRFDGYYVLSDLIDIPNLYQRAVAQWRYLADRYLLGTPNVESTAQDGSEWWWLTGYGALSFAYRMLIFGSMLLLLADNSLPLAIVFVLLTLVMGVVLPAQRWVSHLRSPALMRNRRRAVAVSLALVAIPGVAVFWWPWPNSIRAPGLVETIELTRVPAAVAGRLDRIETPHGLSVVPGQVLLSMSNPALEQQIVVAQAQVREFEVQLNLALEGAPASVAGLEKRLNFAREQLALLLNKQADLTIRAKHAGTWIAEGLHERLHTWLPRGEAVGELSNPAGLRFSAIVSQEQASELFAQPLSGAELRINGQAAEVLRASRIVLLPYSRDRLPSQALSWHAGGVIPVRPDDPEGLQVIDSYYELQAVFDVTDQRVTAMHGMTGWLRAPLPPASLFEQGRRALYQLLQKRYRL